MRKNKSGEPAIPKAEWSTRAHMHRKFADELLGIAKAAGAFGEALLQSTIDRHLSRAHACDELAAETKKGRPKAATEAVSSPNRLAAILSGIPAKRQPGRPRKSSEVDMNELTYRVVEKRRTELAKSNKTKPTVKAAIDSINIEVASRNGVREREVLKGDFDLVHSAYKRGKKQASAKSQN